VRIPRSLDVTLDASTIDGAISLGQDTWEVTHFASGNTASQEIGYAAATELGMFCEEGYGLSLKLTNGAVWNVTETSYLTELTVDATSTVNGVITETADGFIVEPAAAEASGEAMNMADGSMPPPPPADLAPGEEPPGGFGGID